MLFDEENKGGRACEPTPASRSAAALSCGLFFEVSRWCHPLAKGGCRIPQRLSLTLCGWVVFEREVEVATILETHASVELGLHVDGRERRVSDTSRAHGCALQGGNGGGGGRQRARHELSNKSSSSSVLSTQALEHLIAKVITVVFT